MWSLLHSRVVTKIFTLPTHTQTHMLSLSHVNKYTPLPPPRNDERYSIIKELKQLVFSDLEHLLTAHYHRGLFLPYECDHKIVVPLLHCWTTSNVQPFVEELSSVQQERHAASFCKRPMEFCSPPEKQVGMAPWEGKHSDLRR